MPWFDNITSAQIMRDDRGGIIRRNNHICDNPKCPHTIEVHKTVFKFRITWGGVLPSNNPAYIYICGGCAEHMRRTGKLRELGKQFKVRQVRRYDYA